MLGVLFSIALSSQLYAGLPSSTEALALIFPGAQLIRKEHLLSEAQAERVRALAQSEGVVRWAVVYEARKAGALLGFGVFDSHRVRTLNETLLVAISPAGRILRVELVAFREPAEYMAKGAWTQQFVDRGLDAELSLKGAIRPLSGATLTAHAMTDAARRCLALHRVLYGEAR